MKKNIIQLPIIGNSTRKVIYIIEFDLDEEIKFDNSLGVSFDRNVFVDEDRIGDKSCYAVAIKPVHQYIKLGFRYDNSDIFETVELDEGIIPAWTALTSIPKNRFDHYGPDIFTQIKFEKVTSKSVSKENGNMHICVCTDPNDMPKNVPILKKHVTLMENDTTIVPQGCVALLQDSSSLMINGQTHDNIYYLIARTQNINLQATKNSNIIIVRYDDSIQEI